LSSKHQFAKLLTLKHDSQNFVIILYTYFLELTIDTQTHIIIEFNQPRIHILYDPVLEILSFRDSFR